MELGEHLVNPRTIGYTVTYAYVLRVHAFPADESADPLTTASIHAETTQYLVKLKRARAC